MPDHSLANFFRPQILPLSAYKVADAKNLIKLDAMENPYDWPPDIRQEWLDVLRDCAINRYPDAEARELSAALRSYNEIPEQSGLLLGNGSDEIIQILLMAMPTGASVIAPEPGFVMYKLLAQILGLNYQGIPLLAGDFGLDKRAMLAAIEKFMPALIFLAYPNNPTGNLFDEQSILEILNVAPGLVVIDEAYAPFTDATFIGRLNDYDNLLVMRTLSKLGLAGLRLGFLAGHPYVLEQLNKIRLPYNINSLSQATATFALQRSGFLKQQAEQIRLQRSAVFLSLQAIPNVSVYPSSANFILFKTLDTPAENVFDTLKTRGVLIKNLSSQGGLLNNCLRVTIGTPEENQIFLECLSDCLASSTIVQPDT